MITTPIRLCILGSEAAGKTCLLAGLAIRAAPNQVSPFQVLGRAPASQQYIFELAAILNRQAWPPFTTGTTLLDLDIKFRHHLIRLVTLDYPGEDFREAMNQLNYEQNQHLREHLMSADVLLLVLDPDVDLRSAEELTPEERQRQHERLAGLQNSILAVFLDLHNQKRRRRRKRIPDIAIILSKSDKHPELQDSKSAQKFFCSRALSLWNSFRSSGATLRCFPISAVGAVEMKTGPENNANAFSVPAAVLHPKGYDELFQWIVNRATVRRRRIVWGTLAAAAVLAGVLGTLWWGQLQVAINHFRDTNTPLHRLIELDDSVIWPTGQYRRELDKRVDSHLHDIQARAERQNLSIPALDEMLQDLKHLRKLQHTSRLGEIEQMQEQLGVRSRQMRYQTVEDAFHNRLATFRDLAHEFMQLHSSGSDVDMVRQRLQEHEGQERTKARQLVKSISPQEHNFFVNKTKAIEKYLVDYSQIDLDAKAIEKAADLARQLALPQYYDVRLEKFGIFSSPRKHSIMIYQNNELLQTVDSIKATTRSSWDNHVFRLYWTPGDKLRVVVREYSGWDEDVAWIEEKEPLSLQLLSGKKDLKVVNDSWAASFSHGPYVHFTLYRPGCRTVPKTGAQHGQCAFSEEDWHLLRDWIFPGDKW